MAFAQGELGKMTIIFYPKSELPGVGGITFTPMYNPKELTVNHDLNYDQNNKSLVGSISKKFLYTSPRTISTSLFFDGTGASPSNLNSGVSDSGINQGFKNDVVAQVETFLSLAYRINNNKISGGGSTENNDQHKPMYMLMMWGTFIMTCVLQSASVKYTMFDTDGTPLRATLDIRVAEHSDPSLIEKILKLNSPDVTKAVTVKEGDTLPNLCFKEYGDASLYTQVAEVNNLKNFRKLEPGMQLVFPPIAKTTTNG